MAGWKTEFLGMLADVIDPHPSHRAPPESKEGIPFPGIGDFREDGALDFSSCRIVDASVYEDHRKRYKVIEGAIGFGRVASIGKVIRLRSDLLPYAVSPTMAILMPKAIYASYLAHFLKGPQLTEQLAGLLTGTTRSSLGIELLRKLKVSYPDDEKEQELIGQVLSTLDKAIEQTEAIIAKQQRIKSGLMQDLLTKGIDEHGTIRSEATHEFKDSPLGRIPVEWDIEPLGKIASLVTSGSRGWARFYSNDGAVFLRIGNLTREHINFRFDDVVYVNVPESSEGKRTAVQDGDLLISITADLGIIAVVPKEFPGAYVNQHIALIRLDKEAVVPRFIGHLLNGFIGQMQIDKLNESGAKAGLNLPTIENLLVFKPLQSEQEKIVDILDRIDNQIAGDKMRMDKLRHQKTGLMHDLLTGKVRVKPEAVFS